MKKNCKKFSGILFSVLILFGCAAMTKNFGTIVPDQGVEKNFETFQLDPDMNYYFSGSDVFPSVIMGLKKQYALDNDLWRPLATDPKHLKELISDMQSKAGEFGKLQRGFVMKSPDGQTLGVWYSPFNLPMRLKMGADNKVIVYTPDPGSYPYDSGGRRRGR